MAAAAYLTLARESKIGDVDEGALGQDRQIKPSVYLTRRQFGNSVGVFRKYAKWTGRSCVSSYSTSGFAMKLKGAYK